ncbi:MAG: hypothetical protein RIA69_07200 [Cyclobacteriaceae bacterium]
MIQPKIINNCNDGSDALPRLRIDINYWNTHDLPEFSDGPVCMTEELKYETIAKAGYSAVQDGDPALCKRNGLSYTGQFRVNQVGDLDPKLKEWVDQGYDCATIHLGWGMESEEEVHQLVEYVLNASSKSQFPIYIETHRATVTQDMWRTVQIVKKFPEIRFNGDFSHWYTGLEMVNGNWEDKLTFIQPVIDRVRFIHGRISNPGSIQVTIENQMEQPFVGHFREIWTRCFEGFLRTAKNGDYLPFTPELLPSEYYYARLIKGQNGNDIEEGDRWKEARLLCNIAKECWDDASKRMDRSITSVR